MADLGDWVKALEKQYATVENFSPTKYTILRVDGHCFHTYTKKFMRPCDPRIIKAMRHATITWMKAYHGQITYTQSDECTLILPPTPVNELGEISPLVFNGRMLKICTLTASLFSLAFYDSIGREEGTDSSVPSSLPAFDCRGFQVDTWDDVVKVVYWRQLDTFRNGISAYSRQFFSTKMLQNKNTSEQIEMLKENGAIFDGILNDTWLAHLFYGSIVRKINVLREHDGDIIQRRQYTSETEHSGNELGYQFIVKLIQ